MIQGRRSMKYMLATVSAVLLVSACTLERTRTVEAAPQSSSEMKQIFNQDQADRSMNIATMTPKQWAEWGNKVGPRDEQRRKRVIELMNANALQTGEDFEEAAFVFQHGNKPEDFLMAHTLAVVAIAKGNAKARWIAAATLDRYLQKIKQPQIYGTQYVQGANEGDRFTQAPYNENLVPDALRKAVCVPDLSSQKKTLEELNENKEPSPSRVPGC